MNEGNICARRSLKVQLHLDFHYIKRLQIWGSSIKWLTLLSWSENKFANMKYNVKKYLATYLGAYNRNYPDWNLSKTYIIKRNLCHDSPHGLNGYLNNASCFDYSVWTSTSCKICFLEQLSDKYRIDFLRISTCLKTTAQVVASFMLKQCIQPHHYLIKF